jgi:hypothetical protein
MMSRPALVHHMHMREPQTGRQVPITTRVLNDPDDETAQKLTIMNLYNSRVPMCSFTGVSLLEENLFFKF